MYKLEEELLNTTFTKKDISMSYRSINHYDQMGLLLNMRKNTSHWRKFNGIELIWLNIIITLRELGMPVKKIALLKKKLFDEGGKGSIDKANFILKSFEEEINSSIQNKYELFLLVFNDCSFTFLDSLSLNQWYNGIYKSEPHINIPLSSIINEVLTNVKSKRKLK